MLSRIRYPLSVVSVILLGTVLGFLLGQHIIAWNGNRAASSPKATIDIHAGPANIDVIEDSVFLAVGSETLVPLVLRGELPDDFRVDMEIEGQSFDASWVPGCKGDMRYLEITGTREGLGSITVSLEDTASEEVLATGVVLVKVGKGGQVSRVYDVQTEGDAYET